jgi:predicted acetyltransferase
MYDTGCALSTLFPATLPIYRRAGYEVAGATSAIHIPDTRLINVPPAEIDARPVLPDDLPTVHEIYRSFARQHPGTLDRGPTQWKYIIDPMSEPRICYLLVHRATGRAEGNL